MAIKNKKHSELERALNAQKKKIREYEGMIKHYSRLEPEAGCTNTALYRLNVHNSILGFRELRAEALKKCAYLKKMINQVQRTYSLNQNH